MARFLVLACLCLLGPEVCAMTANATDVLGKGAVLDSATITVLFNNVPHDPGLETGWGMACLVEHAQGTVLFDTGGDGRVLLANMRALGKDPGRVDHVVLSHEHGDHTGGVWRFLEAHGRVEVHAPEAFSRAFRARVERAGARFVPVDGPVEIVPGVWTTGEMGRDIREQALVLRTRHGLVVVTGCAHPGVVEIARQAMDVCEDGISLLAGGFHLAGQSRAHVRGIVEALRAMGVQRVGPSHCTGDEAMRLFRQAWGEDFLDLGCGAVLVVE